MIRITYDEHGPSIKIDIDSADENGMQRRDMVLHMVAIVGGIATFIQKTVGDDAADAFINTVGDINTSVLMDNFRCEDDKNE